MAAWFVALLAEVDGEFIDLAAVVCDERNDLLDSLRLRLFAKVKPLDETVEQLRHRTRPTKKGVALPRIGNTQLDQRLLLEMLECRNDPTARLSQLAR